MDIIFSRDPSFLGTSPAGNRSTFKLDGDPYAPVVLNPVYFSPPNLTVNLSNPIPGIAFKPSVLSDFPNVTLFMNGSPTGPSDEFIA